MKIANSNVHSNEHLPINEAVKLLSDSTGAAKPAGAPTGEYEWYTPKEYVDMVRHFSLRKIFRGFSGNVATGNILQKPAEYKPIGNMS